MFYRQPVTRPSCTVCWERFVRNSCILSTNHSSYLHTAGEVHIWDCESARLLHSLRAQDRGSDLTCVAWNHASTSSLMFASASHDGTVRIWTAPVPQDPALPPTNHHQHQNAHAHHSYPNLHSSTPSTSQRGAGVFPLLSEPPDSSKATMF